MPLILADIGEQYLISRIGGNTEVRSHLHDLGFVVGCTVEVVAAMGGNLILNVKGSRIAISREMAQKIMVEMP